MATSTIAVDILGLPEVKQVLGLFAELVNELTICRHDLARQAAELRQSVTVPGTDAILDEEDQTLCEFEDSRIARLDALLERAKSTDHFVDADKMVTPKGKSRTPRTTAAIRKSSKGERPAAQMAECSKAIERDLMDATEALLALSLANRNAAPLTQWQQTATKKADELLARIGA